MTASNICDTHPPAQGKTFKDESMYRMYGETPSHYESEENEREERQEDS